MSLVLSLKEGGDFFVKDERFVVAKIFGPKRFQLRHLSKKPETFEITDAHSTEIMEDVYASAGDQNPSGMIRIAIDAPPDLLILRGVRYRETKGH